MRIPLDVGGDCTGLKKSDALTVIPPFFAMYIDTFGQNRYRQIRENMTTRDGYVHISSIYESICVNYCVFRQIKNPPSLGMTGSYGKFITVLLPRPSRPLTYERALETFECTAVNSTDATSGKFEHFGGFSQIQSFNEHHR